jgi:Spy/CpxP family protein refolding chaperone
MYRNKYTIPIIVLLTALLTIVFTSCCYHRTPEQRAERVVKHLISTLDLDAAQKTKLEKMKEEFLARRPDMVKTREESFNEVTEMMKSPQIDQEKLNARMEKIQVQASDLIRFASAKFVELHDMLTPEQRKKLADEIEKHAQRFHRW